MEGGRTIVVTADHGHLEVHGEETMVLGAEQVDEALTAALRCAPTVEPRSPGFHLRDGADKERFAEDFRHSRCAKQAAKAWGFRS